MGKKKQSIKDQKNEKTADQSKPKSKKPRTKDEIKQLMQKALEDAKRGGLSFSEIQRDITRALTSKKIPVTISPSGGNLLTSLRRASFFVLIGTVAAVLLAFSLDFSSDDFVDFLQSQECLIPSNIFVNEIGRPVSDCNMCHGLERVPVATRMTKEEFLLNHAYSGRPVLIKQATSNWTALENFDYFFFRELYEKFPDSAEMVESHCNFLRYQTEFLTFLDFLRMDNEKVQRLDWYVGWSNCDRRVMKELRKHYERPTFLPDDSISSGLDWIFMGGAGPGAGLHIDMVNAVSWQAQIKGEKIWTLVPPYECEHVCREMNVTVEQGDIFVLDTNIWFHKTQIVDGEMSVTIGSEYN